ncbi:serine-rich adhesin for platelets-like isoform X4 [Daphnia magna]|uniref:serine-rich adhesin for platelets-like isoform X4 n=1 Tax=Daphnia magna TaxID=35525 RepID=UPI001E1BA24F|nr:serine-rich adhesin for platelets-like isoform X4 [Daphnia magna]
MAADHHIQQHQAHQHHSSQQPTTPSTTTITREDSLERLFPRCRLRSPPVDTAVLIDLSDDNVVQTSAALPLHSFGRPTPMTHADGGQSDSDASPIRRPPSLKLNIAAGQPQQQQLLQQRRYCPSVKYRTESAELRRSKFLRRPRTLDHNTWSLYGDVYAGGYEPSSDSEDNDGDHFGFPSGGKSGNVAPAPSSSSSSSSLRKSNPSASAAVRTSASESHIVGHWKKGGHNGHHAEAAGHQRHPRRRGVKEIYDLTPTLSAGSASGGGGGASGSSVQLDPTRMEIAGGREIVSLSRSRTRGSQRKQHRVQSMVDPAPVDSPPNNNNNSNNNNNNSTPSSSSNRSMNRYSGEVYYEESVGRYGFHVGGGNTLWGSQGLEPSFSIASHLNEKQYPSSGNAAAAGMADGTAAKSEQTCAQHHGLKRPLSWAGDDPVTDRQMAEQHPQREARELASASSPDRQGQSSDGEAKPSATLPNGPSTAIEDAAGTQMQAVHGYLTDFYPEVVAAELNSADPSSPSPLNLDNYLSEQLNQFAQQKSIRREASEAEEASQLLLSQSPPAQQQLTVATVIGGLTIAQYEGSPRRYGVRAHPAAMPVAPVNANGQDEYSDECGRAANGPIAGLPQARPLVPGFPRRITSSPNPAHPQATFSPSATRQTLVDLAAGPAATSTPVAATPEALSANHLSWHLEDVDDRSIRSSGGQDQHADAISLNAETDLGETEVGLQMGKSRNFTLSPETTDYDDSELDIYNGAELSVCPDIPALNGTQTSASCHVESFDGVAVGAETAGRRRNSSKSQNGLKGQFSSMPILEDGLSSGRSSAASGHEDISVASSASITSASDTEEDAVTDRIPLMSDRRMKQLSAQQQHALHPANNGCRNLAGASPLQSSITGLSGARSTKNSCSSSSSSTTAAAAGHQQQQQPQAMWSKKLSSALSDCDHHNHQEAGIIQGSFRARNATPPPPAPIAHRPPSSTTQQHAVQTAASTSPTVSNGVKSFAAASAVGSVGAQQNRANNHASPLRLSPGPDTPSITSGGAGGSSSSSSSSSSGSSCSSSGVGSSAGKMQNVGGQQQPKRVGPSGDLSLHELGDALDHGRMRKASSVPPPAAVAAIQSPLSRSPPIWVPRQSSDYWAKNSPTSTSPRSRCKVGGSGMHPDGSKLNVDDDDERETDQLLRDPDDQGFFDEHARPPVASDVGRAHPATRMGSPPTPSSLRSASTASSSTRSSPQQQQQVPQNHQPTMSVAAAATAALANGTSPSSSSGGGPPPPSRQSEPKDLKYRETTPSAKKKDDNSSQSKKKGRSKEVLIEGVLFRANYLGSTQIVCEGQPTKYTRMMQAEEAVSRIKDQDIGQDDGETGSHSSPASISFDEEDEDLETDAVAADESMALDLDDTQPESSADLSISSTRIHVNPGSETAVTSRSSCDFNANVSSCSGQSPRPEHLYGQDDDDEEQLDEEDDPPCVSSKVIHGCSFRLVYHGSSEIDELQPDSSAASGSWKYRTKKGMVEEAVLKLKAPEGETQPTTEVDLFISTEKIMVLNTELKEIMMDHALRTISYIADIGDLVVLMARRRMITQDGEDSSNKIAKTPKMVCHVFESEEAQFIAQSIGQAFQVAYMEFLKANGIEDQSFVREMDYQEVLNSQEIFGDELQMFAKKELQKEVIVPKARNEILGVVIVESGWGSMLPTVVIANLAPAGAAARCGQLNIGDQIIAINGISLVGLPLSTCQTYIKNAKSATVVKLTVVPCPPVVEVKIKRPDTKYQLGFSVQNGVICSLLRGGIAERGGVRVGHRIIEINGQSVVAVPHERIVGLLATSVGEINMKTMPTSMFRLLIGQETPVYI